MPCSLSYPFVETFVKLAFQIFPHNLVERDVFDYELKEFMIRMKKKILKVLLPFVSFLHVFDKEKGHNMLILMFDPRFKNMHLVTMFLGHENATGVVIEYDEKLLLPLLMVENKLLMHDRVEGA
jgi:hypothetical protein